MCNVSFRSSSAKNPAAVLLSIGYEIVRPGVFQEKAEDPKALIPLAQRAENLNVVFLKL